MPMLKNELISRISPSTIQNSSSRRKLNNHEELHETVIEGLLQGSKDSLNPQYNLLLSKRAHELPLERFGEIYGGSRFVLHRKLLRRRHVRKEQKRLRQTERARIEESGEGISTQKFLIKDGRNSAAQSIDVTVDTKEKAATDIELVKICQEKIGAGSIRVQSYSS